MSSEDTPRLGYPVDVIWPGNHRRGMLQYPPQGGSSFEGPVLVIDGKAYGAPELPRGSKVLVYWREARTGPVWELIHRGMATGQFPIEVLEDERDEDTYRLMAEITLLRSQVAHTDLHSEIDSLKGQLAEKDKQISELHVLLARTQPKQVEEQGKRPFWKRWLRGP